MGPPRSLEVRFIGVGCCIFAGLWILWLLINHGGDFLNLLSAVAGNRDQQFLDNLAWFGLNRPGMLRFTFAQFMIQTALAGVLAWSGYAILQRWPAAWWTALGTSVFSI